MLKDQLHDVTSLTRRCRLSAELLSQVGAFGQAVQVPLQDVPAHLVVEGETELGMNLKMSNKCALKFCCSLFASREAQSSDFADSYLGPILDLMDGELHRNVETVQDVAPKHQRVLRSVDGVDPAWNPNQFRSKHKGME